MITKNKAEKTITKYFVTFFILHSSLFTLPHLFSAFADTVTNDNYSINVGDIDTNPQPTKRPLPTIANKKISSLSSFQSANSLSLRLSQDSIDFGILSSTNPVIRISTIQLSSKQIGAEILTYENHPLLSSTNDLLQNTSCDNGACTSQTAAEWNNTLTYGFGYRCDSTQENTCDPQFATTDYYKQYPNDSKNEPPTVLLTNASNNNNAKATITNKVNISGTQKATAYYNSITYLAIPKF